MKIYLVGGAVRDQLMGISIKERDWVVVGSTPQDLIHQGYRPVGRDFPVFLHPETQEEYALARTERKSAPGYHGFQCNFNPQVTLLEDLGRRDLTINAIAMDTDGTLIDPYHGKDDLKHCILRHVSNAFVEDPVRVLRVARFMARYAHLNFTIATKTQALMRDMVKNGELNHLVPERVWQEWNKSLQEKNPEIFLETLHACGALSIILPELTHHQAKIKSYMQHVHRMSHDPVILFSTLALQLPVHEIKTLCTRMHVPKIYQACACLVASYAEKIMSFSTLSSSEIVDILEKTDAFRRPELFEKLLIVCKACYHVDTDLDPMIFWQNVCRVCQEIDIHTIITSGDHGLMIKQKLHHERVHCVEHYRDQYEKRA